MIIQLDNQNYIREADRYTGFLVSLNNANRFLKNLFGLVGLIIFAVVLSPFVMLLLWRLTSVTSKMVRESREEKKKLMESLKDNKLNYKDFIKIESSLKKISENSRRIAYLKSDKSPKIMVKLLDNLYFFNKEIQEMQKIIKNSYSYNKTDIGLSDTELEEYNNQFKELKDIWDYESSVEEKNIVFNHKRQLHA